jgi:hypothetical protein
VHEERPSEGPEPAESPKFLAAEPKDVSGAISPGFLFPPTTFLQATIKSGPSDPIQVGKSRWYLVHAPLNNVLVPT